MKFLLAAAVACLYLAVASAERTLDKEGYYYEQRERLGHFKDYPFTDLYKTYATAFVYPLHPERPRDDFRNYLPSADECMVFLRKFRIDEYKLRDIEQFVVLDACLGYLYESTYQDKDRENSQQVAANLDAFIADEHLKALYDGTHLNDFNDQAKECIGDLFLDAIRAKKQFSDVECNNHWIQVFNDFAECHSNIAEEARDTDSYMKELYELVKNRGNRCFLVEIQKLNEGIRKEYINNPFDRSTQTVSKFWNPLHKQQKGRIWPKVLSRLLSAVQGTKQEVNMREVNAIIRGIGLNQEPFRRRLLNNMARYADETIKPKRGDKKDKQDPMGDQRYNALVDDLCNFFRASDNPSFYDYSTPFVRMIRMLKHPEIFGITQEYFVRHVLNNSEESGALYLAVSSCNLLTFTEAAFEHRVGNGPQKYKVVFKPDTSEMVQWPDAGFF